MRRFEMLARTLLNLVFFALTLVFLFQWSATMNEHKTKAELLGLVLSGAEHRPAEIVEREKEELAELARGADRMAMYALGSLTLTVIGFGLQWWRLRRAQPVASTPQASLLRESGGKPPQSK